VGPAAAATPYCGITWGSLPKVDPGMSEYGVAITGVRAGRHDCYDRLVVDVNHGSVGGYSVQYVDTVFTDPKGDPLQLRGGARLEVVVHAPNNVGSQVTYFPSNQQEVVNVTGFSTFRQVAWAGSFEGFTTLGLGTRARLPFRVFTLPADAGHGPRVVVDVAHRW
jgi:hypothetical protein